MISCLTLHGVGPAPQLSLKFGDRLNIITGDNGLGKSFLLDVIWWAITRSWPSEINPGAMAGRKARPAEGGEGNITVQLHGASERLVTRSSDYDSEEEKWVCPSGRPPRGGLTIYAMVDGSFAVWDPARNYWKEDGQQAPEGRLPAYVFTPDEIWNGQTLAGKKVFKGFIEDFSNMNFREGGGAQLLSKALEILSPEGENYTMGKKTARISVADPRDIPTVCMPYTESDGEGVPVIHVSSALKRILSLAYMLVWAWLEHKAARGKKEPTRRITFLIDEIESHLHPRWQRSILASVMKAIDSLVDLPDVKLIFTTHSPLVMASCEDVFSDKTDCWFDLDFNKESGNVELTQRDFEKKGGAEAWLASPAFDLSVTRSREAEKALQVADELLQQDQATPAELLEAEKGLAATLNSYDPAWIRWKWLVERKFSHKA